MASPREMFEQIISITEDLSPIQKIIGGVLIAAVLSILVMISVGDKTTDYAVLYTSLSQEDAADVTARLKEQRIPYQLEMNGTVIKVPSDKVLDTRLSLAGEGLPRGGGVGFEIFDRTNLGTTDFVQKLNYQRALQGELARTISKFHQVQEARVHIATPKESIFIEDERPTSASVSLKLAGSNKLTKNQIQAIVNLVGSAVPGLSEDHITVVDTAGRLLYRKQGDEESMLSASQLEYQLKIERTLSTKLESMFEEIVGVGKVVARVSAELDFNQVDTTQEMFDPEGQVVRSEQLLNDEISKSGQKQSGVPGVKGNLATFTEGDDVGSGGDSSQRHNVTRNYEVSKTVKRVKEAVGAVKRLSVAIMVDGAYEKEIDKAGNPSIKYIPRSVEELKRFEVMAQNAVGLDAERGDQLEVVGMSFASSMVIEEKADSLEKWQRIIERLTQPIIYLMVAICFVFFVVRPFFRLLSNKQLEEQRRAMLAKVEEENIMEDDDLSLRPVGMTDRERITKLAHSDPDRAADLVRRWLREEA